MAISTHKYRLLMKREPKTYVVSKAFVNASIPLTQIPSERRTTSLDWSRTKLLPLTDIVKANWESQGSVHACERLFSVEKSSCRTAPRIAASTGERKMSDWLETIVVNKLTNQESLVPR